MKNNNLGIGDRFNRIKTQILVLAEANMTGNLTVNDIDTALVTIGDAIFDLEQQVTADKTDNATVPQ